MLMTRSGIPSPLRSRPLDAGLTVQRELVHDLAVVEHRQDEPAMLPGHRGVVNVGSVGAIVHPGADVLEVRVVLPL